MHFQRYGRESSEKHLPFWVHISTGNIKVFCDTPLFAYPHLMKFYWFLTLLTLWRYFLKYQIWQFVTIFLEKYFSIWPFFQWMFVIFSSLKWTEEFFLLWLPRKPIKWCFHDFHGNSCKREKFLCLFQKAIMWTSTPREFQPKATIISLEKMSNPVQLFPINRALDPSNRFVTKKKIYDSLMFRSSNKKNFSSTFIFSVLQI